MFRSKQCSSFLTSHITSELIIMSKLYLIEHLIESSEQDFEPAGRYITGNTIIPGTVECEIAGSHLLRE